LIPVQAAYLPVRGLEQLIMTISRVKKHINTKIHFEGILISMVDSRTVYAREIIELVKENYGESLRIFDTMIPFSVRAAETSAAGMSIFHLYPEHKVAQAYGKLTEEVIASAHNGEKGGGDNE
jgi:chromosome partitioning protein